MDVYLYIKCISVVLFAIPFAKTSLSRTTHQNNLRKRTEQQSLPYESNLPSGPQHDSIQSKHSDDLAINDEVLDKSFQVAHHHDSRHYKTDHHPHSNVLPVPDSDRIWLMMDATHTYAGDNEKMLQLTASPQTIVFGETETFTVKCSVNMPALARQSKGNVQPISIEIDKHEGQIRRRLAVLSAIHGVMPIRDDLTSGAKITGSVVKDETNPWTLSIQWPDPISALEGTYLCKLSAFGPDMILTDHAYSKLDVTIKDSPRIKLEERLVNAEMRLDEANRDGQRKDGALRLLRTMLVNVTELLVDTSNHSRVLKQKLNKQAATVADMHKYVNIALEAEERLAKLINNTERSLASTLEIQAQAMSQLHNQDRIFAAGLHSLDLRSNSLEQRITNAKERMNEKIDSQRLDIMSQRKSLEEMESHQTKTDSAVTEIEKMVLHLSDIMNKTIENINNLQNALGLSLGSIRLNNNGTFGREGRLEVFYNGQWGSVCDDNFDINAARVVCKQLGYNIDKATFMGNAHYGPGVGLPIHLDDVVCYGQETKLIRCSHSAWGFHGCTHDEDVGVRC